MLVKEKLYTIDDWWEISSRPDNAHKLLELIEGDLPDWDKTRGY